MKIDCNQKKKTHEKRDYGRINKIQRKQEIKNANYILIYSDKVLECLKKINIFIWSLPKPQINK